MHRPWLRHQALTIFKKSLNDPIKLPEVFKILKCVIPKPFEIATPLWMWIVNGNACSKYNIPHSKQFFYSCLLLVDFYCPCFLLIGIYIFSLRICIAENTPTSCFTIHIMKVLRQSPMHMRIHDVAGKSAIYYLHHEGA